jgi:PAS domain S-box-containing protein
MAKKSGWKNLVIRWRHKDGSYRYLESNAVPILSGKGELLGLRGVDRDITERKQAEEELLRYACIVSSSSDMMAILDTNFVYLATNEAYLAAFGMTKDQVVGHTVSQVFGEEFFETIIKPHAERCLEGDKVSYENWFQFPVHGSRFMSISYCPYIGPDGDIRGFVVNARDITERKRAEDQVEKIFNLTGYMVCVAGMDGYFKRVNASFEEVLGYSAEELLARPFNDFVHPEDKAKTAAVVKDKLAAGVQVIGFENRYHCKDGSYKWLSWTSRPVVQEGIMYAIAYDITERKRAEEERENLMQALEARTKELQSIVYTTSHDLQTPLVTVRGFGGELSKYCEQLIKLAGKKSPDEKVRQKIGSLLEDDIPEALKFINAGADKMRSLLEGLTRLSRIGTAAIDIQPINMNKLMKRVSQAMNYQIQEKGASVTIGKLPVCLGDVSQIDQVFTNLLDNALKYLKHRRKGKIDISGRIENDVSIYCIRDNGIGVASEHHEQIFEIFYRLEPGGPAAGEGLGLTIIRRILDRHNGRIWVESEIGKGSYFFVSLPHSKLQESSNRKRKQK